MNKPSPSPAPPGSAPTAPDTRDDHPTRDGSETAPLSSIDYPFLGPPDHPGDLGRLGPYRVVRLLGEGGMGFVFEGEDDQLRRPVALKVMRPEIAVRATARERFLREGRAAAAVKNDHVTTIYQVGEANGVPFLALEFLEGQTLEDWLRAQPGPVRPALVAKVARDVLKGLAAAHAKGLIHRDIKPANLWVEKETNRVKLLDFGLTRAREDQEQLTREGQVVGTPAYMAPEQAEGKPVDARADLFSVGVVLHRMLAGKSPFQRDTAIATLSALATVTPPPARTLAPDLPGPLAGLMDRLLARDPAGRPADARAALAEWQAAEKQATTLSIPPALPVPEVAPLPADPWAGLDDGETEATTTPAPIPKAPRPKKRAPAPLLIALGLLGLMVVAAGAYTVIKIKNKDGTETEVRVPEGSKIEVNGKDVTPHPKQPDTMPPVTASNSPDRAVAEWVLSLGGNSSVIVFVGSGPGLNVKNVDQLPKEPFALQHVWLGSSRATDESLKQLAGCRSIIAVRLDGSNVSEKGLVYLRDHPLEQFQASANNRIGDEGIRQLAVHPWLFEVVLDGSLVTDDGLKLLAGFSNLKGLTLNASKFTDAGLAYLRKCPDLQRLIIQNNQIGNPAVEHLKALPAITTLNIRGTKISRDKVEELHKALPRCRIDSDYGVYGAEDVGSKAAEVVGPAPKAEPWKPAAAWKPIPVGESPFDKLDPKAIPAGERFDWQPKELVAVIGSHSRRMWEEITAAAISPDGKLGATAEHGGMVAIWDLGSQKLVGSVVSGEGNGLGSVCFMPDGRGVVACRANGGASFIDLSGPSPKLGWFGKKFEPGKGIGVPGGELQWAAVFENGRTLAIGASLPCEKLQLAAFDISGDEPRRNDGPKGRILAGLNRGVVFAPAGGWVFYASSQGKLRRASIQNARFENDEELPIPLADREVPRAATPDGKKLALWSGDHLEVWDLNQKVPKQVQRVSAEGIAAGAVRSDSQFFFS